MKCVHCEDLPDWERAMMLRFTVPATECDCECHEVEREI